MKHGTGYKVGYKIGFSLSKLLVRFVRLLWKGIVTASIKRKPLIFVYSGLLLGAFISYNMYGSTTIFILAIIVLGVIFGIIEKPEEPEENLCNYFVSVFREIGLQEDDESVPRFLYKKELSNYAHLLAFNTIIPLNEWNKKKDKLEMYLNVKILDIRHHKENNRTTEMIIQTENLPTTIEWDKQYMNYLNNALRIGVGYYGNVEIDLDKFPHTFIAGETGSGKSNVLKCLIYQTLIKRYRVKLIDFKRGVSFSSFKDSVDLCYEHADAERLLADMVEETKNRLDLFRNYNVDNIIDYNNNTDDSMERIIIFIDELAELLKIRDKEMKDSLYDSLETLSRLSRSAGIHLIMGIQRPDSTVINGQIKNNVSFRICGRFVDKEPSRIMLGSDMASNLPNIKGRFIVKGGEIEEVQAFYYVGESLPKNPRLSKEEEEQLEKDVDEFLEEFAQFKSNREKAEESEGQNTTTPNMESKEQTLKEDTEKENKVLFDFSDMKK